MQDQVWYLRSVGIKAKFTGDEQESKEANQQVERGDCQIVYGSPEAFLSTKRWQAMLSNDAYNKRLCLVAADEAHRFLMGKTIHHITFPSVLLLSSFRIVK